jgi:hypothetical protein
MPKIIFWECNTGGYGITVGRNKICYYDAIKQRYRGAAWYIVFLQIC